MPWGPGGGGGGLLNNVLYGRLRQEVQPFNILYTIFDIFDTFYWQMISLSHTY